MTAEEIRSDQPKDDDHNKFKVWEIDIRGGQRRLAEEADDIYDNIQEVIQNAVDSGKDVDNYADKEAIANIWAHDYPNAHNRVLTVEDFGLGITKDYNGDINAFLNAKKATSNKVKGRGIGYKGVGMIQYPNIGKDIVIISQDDTNVYRIPITQESGISGFGNWDKWPIESLNEDYRKNNLHLTHRGSKVTFFNRPEKVGKIDQQTLINRTKKYFGLMIKRSPKVLININNIRLTPPDYLNKEGYPEIDLFKLDQTIDSKVTGALWPDKKGSGVILIHVDGAFVEEYRFDARRRCSGWIAIEDGVIDVTTSRDRVLKHGPVWREICDKMVSIWMHKFELAEEEDESKAEKEDRKKKTDMLTKIFSKILPRFPGLKIEDSGLKIEVTGNAKPEEGEDKVTGYRISKEPNPDRIIIERKPPGPRINRKPNQVGLIGTDTVKAENPENPDKKQEPSIRYVFTPLQPADPFLLYHTDEAPYTVEVNTMYPLYPKCFKKDVAVKDCIFRLAPYIAPIYAKALNPDIDKLTWFESVTLVQSTILDIMRNIGAIK
jgi:hypothetical protein